MKFKADDVSHITKKTGVRFVPLSGQFELIELQLRLVITKIGIRYRTQNQRFRVELYNSIWVRLGKCDRKIL